MMRLVLAAAYAMIAIVLVLLDGFHDEPSPLAALALLCACVIGALVSVRSGFRVGAWLCGAGVITIFIHTWMLAPWSAFGPFDNDDYPEPAPADLELTRAMHALYAVTSAFVGSAIGLIVSSRIDRRRPQVS